MTPNEFLQLTLGITILIAINCSLKDFLITLKCSKLKRQGGAKVRKHLEDKANTNVLNGSVSDRAHSHSSTTSEQ